MNQELYHCYLSILERELVPAMGCTEPIAIAYAGALARKTLGKLPQRIELIVSGNIIKNVKSVIVPHTGGRKDSGPLSAQALSAEMLTANWKFSLQSARNSSSHWTAIWRKQKLRSESQQQNLLLIFRSRLLLATKTRQYASSERIPMLY